jgi:hypothetical protein
MQLILFNPRLADIVSLHIQYDITPDFDRFSSSVVKFQFAQNSS